MEPIRHVLVALDFHGPSLRGLDYAARLARSVGARVTLLHACEMPMIGYGPAPVPVSRGELHAAAAHDLGALADALRAGGIDVHLAIEDGLPPEAILEAARTRDVDLIVIGTHGRHGLARVVLGSVAEQVVRRASVPVITMHEWCFENRAEAGARLAKRLAPCAGEIDLTIAITRGAVGLAIEASRALRTRVETFLVEPITAADGAPLGAVAEDGTMLLDDSRIAEHHEPRPRVTRATENARATAQQRARWLRSAPIGDLTGYSVLLVSDALATPAIAQLAARCARRRGAKHVALAVPVAAASVIAALPPDVDRTISLDATHFEPPAARVYRDEEDLTNVEAAEMLVHAAARRAREQALAR